MKTTSLERAAIKLHRFLHDNLGHTTGWPVRMMGDEEALSCFSRSNAVTEFIRYADPKVSFRKCANSRRLLVYANTPNAT